jgi:hypothetical protein
MFGEAAKASLNNAPLTLLESKLAAPGNRARHPSKKVAEHIKRMI